MVPSHQVSTARPPNCWTLKSANDFPATGWNQTGSPELSTIRGPLVTLGVPTVTKAYPGATAPIGAATWMAGMIRSGREWNLRSLVTLPAEAPPPKGPHAVTPRTRDPSTTLLETPRKSRLLQGRPGAPRDGASGAARPAG